MTIDLDTVAWAEQLAAAAAQAGDDVQRGLALAARYGRLLPHPGEGGTAERWAALAAVAERDLTAARILEAHSDALAILHEADVPEPDGTWGVFAAESPDARLDAEHGDGTTLSGVKRGARWRTISTTLSSPLTITATAACMR